MFVILPYEIFKTVSNPFIYGIKNIWYTLRVFADFTKQTTFVTSEKVSTLKGKDSSQTSL